MTSFFKKHPNTMNPQELFDTLTLVQQNAKKQGQHHPMYTAKQPAPGTEAGPEHMHEQATRQQLTSLYEAENPPKAKTPQQPQQPPAPQQQEQQPQEQPQAPMGQQTAQNTTGGLMSDIIPSAAAADMPYNEGGLVDGITKAGKAMAPEVDFGTYALIREHGLQKIASEYVNDGAQGMLESEFRKVRFPAFLIKTKGNHEKAEALYNEALQLYKEGLASNPRNK